MKVQNLKLIQECAKEMSYKNNGDGTWRDRKIPDCIEQAIKEFLPHTNDGRLSKLREIERYIANKCIDLVSAFPIVEK